MPHIKAVINTELLTLLHKAAKPLIIIEIIVMIKINIRGILYIITIYYYIMILFKSFMIANEHRLQNVTYILRIGLLAR
jgi:hypothetical protein